MPSDFSLNNLLIWIFTWLIAIIKNSYTGWMSKFISKLCQWKICLFIFFKWTMCLHVTLFHSILDFLNQLMCTLFAWTADVMKYLSICEIDGNYTDVFFLNLKITTFLLIWSTDKLIDNAKKKIKARIYQVWTTESNPWIDCVILHWTKINSLI